MPKKSRTPKKVKKTTHSKSSNKRFYWWAGLATFLFLLACIGFWIWKGPATAFDASSKSYVLDDNQTDAEQVIQVLEDKHIISSPFLFKITGKMLGVFPKIKPGKYQVQRGESIIDILRTLKNHKQVQVNLVLNKLRLKEDFARLIGKNFSTDSLRVIQFISNNDSIQKYGVDTSTFFTMLTPNTYTLYFNTPLSSILDKLFEHTKAFKTKHKQDLDNQKLSWAEVYIIASIVEEETNHNPEKGTIASVYINRLQKGMMLGADPTIKYALKNFALRRILFEHLKVNSPYNTYKNKGLPPGPICIPSIETLEAVIKAPSTNYLFFVASVMFNGTHKFSATYAEHLTYAKQYQQKLDIYLQQKQP